MKNKENRLWVGTNSPRGIYILQQEESGWHELVRGGPASSTYLIHGPDNYVLAAVETERFEGTPGGAVVSCFLKEDMGKPEIRLCGKAKGLANGICHLAYAPGRRMVFAASYPQGSIDVLKLEENGQLNVITRLLRSGSGPHPEQAGPHAHCCVVTNKEDILYVCDLGTDEIARYELAELEVRQIVGSREFMIPIRPLKPLTLPPGTGPRHLVLSEDEAYLYVVCELSNKVLSIRVSDGEIIQTLYCQPWKEGFCALSSIRLSADVDKKNLIVGCRGMNGIWTVPLLKAGQLGEPKFFASASSFPWDVLSMGNAVCAAAFTYSNRVEIGRCWDKYWEPREVCEVPKPTCLLLSGSIT